MAPDSMGRSLLLLHSDDEGYSKYATADGMSFRDPIDAEQLLKAADDLTNSSHWTKQNVAVADQGDGWFKVTAAGAGYDSLIHIFTNWGPEWARTYSVFLKVKAGNYDELTIGIYESGGANNKISDVEIISGPGTVSVQSGRCEVKGLSTTQETYVRASGYGYNPTAVGVLQTQVLFYIAEVSSGTSNAGDYIFLKDVQLVLGDQAKPRPTQTDPDDWMMAYRPHNRVTADGNARYSVTDTEGLVTCGDCHSIVLGDEVNGTTPANFSYSTKVTIEDGKYWFERFRISGSYRLELQITASRTITLRNITSGGTVDSFSVAALTDGETYRIRFDANGSSVKVYVDDALEIDGTLTDSSLNSNTGVSSGSTYVTPPQYCVVESFPRKSTGLIIAGGKPTPAYGDPGIWLTDPDGNAFAVGASDAVLFTAKTLVAAKIARFGLDDNTASSPAGAYNYLGSNTLAIRPAAGGTGETPQAWTAGTELSFMQLLRSDTHGSQFLLHDTGKGWKRFNVNDDAIPAASAYPSISNYNAALYVTRFALLDLSDVHEEEWCGEVASLSTPSSGTSYTCSDDCHINATFTYETGKNIRFRARSAPTGYLQVEIATAGGLLIWDSVAGSRGAVSSGVFSDGVSYEVDSLFIGDTVYVFVDKVLKLTSYPASVVTGDGTGNVYHGLVTNDIEMTVHAYPALGGNLGATDNRVCWRQGDINTMESNALIMIRDAQVTTSTNARYSFRKIDDDNLVGLLLKGSGELDMYEYKSSGNLLLFNGSGGEYSDDDDIGIVLDDETHNLLVNGDSIGSGSSISQVLVGTVAENTVGGGVTSKATEFWPLYVDIFDPDK
jgi:hypothetical protein